MRKVVVVHDFDAEVDGDLSVRVGDVLQINEVIDDNWLDASLVFDGQTYTGMVPWCFTDEYVAWGELPLEIFACIFSYCDADTRKCIRLTCERFAGLLAPKHVRVKIRGPSVPPAVQTLMRVSSTFTTLDLSSCFIGEEGLVIVATALQSSSVYSLNVSFNGLDGIGQGLAILASSPVVSLNLAHNLIKGSRLDPLLLSTNLKRLDLWNNPLDDVGVSHLARTLNACPARLTWLGLRECWPSQAGSRRYMTPLYMNVTPVNYTQDKNHQGMAFYENDSLRHLDLGGNHINATLIGNTLVCLNLWFCELGNKHVSDISAALICNHSLRKLDLSDNNFGGSGVLALASMLETNKHIVWLSLAGNELCDEGICHLASRLNHNSTLTSLHLAKTRISNAGAFAIATLLSEETTSLTELNLLENSIAADGMQAIVQAIHGRATDGVLQLTTMPILYNHGVPREIAKSLNDVLLRNSQKRAPETVDFLARLRHEFEYGESI